MWRIEAEGECEGFSGDPVEGVSMGREWLVVALVVVVVDAIVRKFFKRRSHPLQHWTQTPTHWIQSTQTGPPDEARPPPKSPVAAPPH